MSVRGLKFVVTGATSGIGRATARRVVQEGALVVIADINAADGEGVAAELRAGGGEAWFIECDVTDARQLDALMRGAATAMGGIDVLHNNAGISDHQLGSPAETSVTGIDQELWDRVLAVNLTAPMFAAQAAVPYLKESENASIINACSVGGLVGFPAGGLAYAASKGGIATLTKALAVALAPFGIRVNAYCPGLIETPMVSAHPLGDEARRDLTANQLVPRMGQPEDIAELVSYLAGPGASFVNGAMWIIDGGQLAWRGTADQLGLVNDAAVA